MLIVTVQQKKEQEQKEEEELNAKSSLFDYRKSNRGFATVWKKLNKFMLTLLHYKRYVNPHVDYLELCKIIRNEAKRNKFMNTASAMKLAEKL